ncbi:MAG TPA: hypothetical protein VK603_10895, partial [Candidatus Saccharimonadales bacterium]|nr:hypothetical protein [Candidatus Saccharimonadales bacterium]
HIIEAAVSKKGIMYAYSKAHLKRSPAALVVFISATERRDLRHVDRAVLPRSVFVRSSFLALGPENNAR